MKHQKAYRKFNMNINVNFILKPLNIKVNYINVEMKDKINKKIEEIIEERKKNKLLKEKELTLDDYQYKYFKINGKIKNNGSDFTFMDAKAKEGSKIFVYFEIIYTLKGLNEISIDKLITRQLILKEKIEKNITKIQAFRILINRANSNRLMPIEYELIPETINDNMFNQGDIGTCYLVAAVITIKEIPSVFENIFIDKKYEPNKNEYRINAFINGKLEVIKIDNKFIFKKYKNLKLEFFGAKPYKYELFLKFIEKMFAKLKIKEGSINSSLKELEKEIIIFKFLDGGHENYLYRCLLGTSCIFYKKCDSKEKFEKERDKEYIENIEKHINKAGVIMATFSRDSEGNGHQYAIKNMYEYESNKGIKRKFIQIINPWGSGDNGEGFFDFNEILKESEDFEYIYEFNKNYNETGKIKIPLDLFSKWFQYIIVCEPKYGYHYKILENKIHENQIHLYLFNNNKKQNVEIELTIDEIDNVCFKTNQNNIKITISKIDENNITPIKETSQIESKFYFRKNAYILEELEESNYLIKISDYTNKNSENYYLRIGGETEFLKEVNQDDFSNFKNKYENMEIINIDDKNFFSQKYILLEKSFYDLKIFSIANSIYNLFYDPYETNIYPEIQNALKRIISIQINAENKKIYEYEKNNENEHIQIRYFYKNILNKLKEDTEILDKSEKEILKKAEELGEDLSKKVEVILDKKNGGKRSISLYNLKKIIKGDPLQKEAFYSSIRGYTITEYGIEEVNSNKKFEQSKIFKEIIIKEMPNLLKNNKDILKNCEFYLPIINEELDDVDNLFDKSKYDIVFAIDSTNSMEKYIEAVTEKCRDIIDEIVLTFQNVEEISFKFGAILYSDPIDQVNEKNIIINLTDNKEDLKKELAEVKCQYGGDDAEDWNGAYELLINEMNWTDDKSIKIVVHIADASNHGIEFTSSGEKDNHPDKGAIFIKTIGQVAKKGIKIIGFPIKESPIHCFKKFMEIYKENKGYSFSNYIDIMPRHEDFNAEIFYKITIEALKFIINHE